MAFNVRTSLPLSRSQSFSLLSRPSQINLHNWKCCGKPGCAVDDLRRFDNRLNDWDLDSGKLVRTFEGHYFNVDKHSTERGGRRAVPQLNDGTLKIWDLDVRDFTRVIEEHPHPVICIATSADGRLGVSFCGKVLKVWDVRSGTPLHTLTPFDGNSSLDNHTIALSADGRRAASSSGDVLEVWDLEAYVPC